MFVKIDFAPEFERTILAGSKTATTRLLKSEPHLDNISVGQLVQCTTNQTTVFGTVRITKIENCRFNSIPEDIALIENYKTVLELQNVLKRFYPSIARNAELRILHFELELTGES